MIAQVSSCDGKEHATHRELTDLRLFYCNCGYSSGWKNLSELPDATEFLRDHLPPGVAMPLSQVTGL